MDKIMMIHHSGLIGGAGVSLVNVMRTLSNDYEIMVCIPSEPEDMRALIRPYESEILKTHIYGRRIGAVTYYSGGDKVLSKRLWYRISLIFCQWKQWNKRIEEYDPDIIILNSKILCWMSMLSQVKCRKSICFVRETMEGKPSGWMNKMISKMLDQFTKVIFLSEYDEKREHLCKAKTHVIHNYIEDGQFDTTINRETASEYFGLKQNTFHVLYVGGVSEMKGFDLAIKAVLQSGSDVELIVAGNDFEGAKQSRNPSAVEYAKQMEDYINEHDLNHQIHIVGKQKNMSNCYAACDVLIFPMRSAHQARPAFEAGYYHKPVIITDFENIREFVNDGENGFTVPADNVENISERIVLLKEQPQLAEMMGKKNWERTRTLHNKDENCKKILELIKE